MSAQIEFLKRCKALGLHNSNLPAWLDEIESLRAQVAELKAENEQLRFQWAGCSQQLKDACDDLSKVEEECSKLTRQRDEAICCALRHVRKGFPGWRQG